MKIIAVDIGGTNISAGLIENGKLKSRTREITNKEDGEKIFLQLLDCVGRILKREKLKIEEVDGIGVAVPGLVDKKEGIVLFTPNLPLKNFPLADNLRRSLGYKKVIIENDGNCAVLGEHVYGDFKKSRDMLMITVGTGIGGGVILNGKLLNKIGSAELAHLTLDVNGNQCSCGKKGCVESYISATALLKMASKMIRKTPNSRLFGCDKMDCEDIFSAYRIHDNGAIKVVDRYMDYFALAVLSYFSVFGDMEIIIGGGVANAGDCFFTPLRNAIEKNMQCLRFSFGEPEIYPASLDDNSALYGAAALFDEKFEG